MIFLFPWTRLSAALVTDSTDAALDMAAGIKNVSGCHPVSVLNHELAEVATFENKLF